MDDYEQVALPKALRSTLVFILWLRCDYLIADEVYYPQMHWQKQPLNTKSLMFESHQRA